MHNNNKLCKNLLSSGKSVILLIAIVPITDNTNKRKQKSVITKVIIIYSFIFSAISISIMAFKALFLSAEEPLKAYLGLS